MEITKIEPRIAKKIGGDTSRQLENKKMAGEILRPFSISSHADHEQPLVPPQVLHFRQVPLRTRVKLPHSPQLSPS